MDFRTTLSIGSAILGSYPLAICLFGTIGNLLTVFICLQKRLRKIPTFVFIAIWCVMDILPLNTINVSAFTLTFYGFQIQDVHHILCKLVSFLSTWGAEASAYLQIAYAFDRLMCVKLSLWRKVYFSGKKAAMLSIAIVSFFFLFNIYLNFGETFETSQNGTGVAACVSISTSRLSLKMFTYIYSLIPFTCLIIINVLLVHSTLCSGAAGGAKRTASKKYRSLNVTVIAQTIIFICLTAPIAIMSAYFLDKLYASAEGQFYIFLSGVLAFTPAASNFLIQFAFNKEFLKECKKVIRGRRG